MNSENSEKFRKKEDSKDVLEVKEKYVKKEEVKDDEGLDKKDRKYYKVTIMLRFCFLRRVYQNEKNIRLEFNRKCYFEPKVSISVHS